MRQSIALILIGASIGASIRTAAAQTCPLRWSDQLAWSGGALPEGAYFLAFHTFDPDADGPQQAMLYAGGTFAYSPRPAASLSIASPNGTVQSGRRSGTG
jgi:hypothetical protein